MVVVQEAKKRLSFFVGGLLFAVAVEAVGSPVLELSDGGRIAMGPETVVQQAIDRLAAKGGGTITVPAGAWSVKPIFLRSNITLKLSEGTVLMGSTNLVDYADPAVPGASRAFVQAEGAENIAILGKGRFDGRGDCFVEHYAHGAAQPKVAPKMMKFAHCKNVRLEDFTYGRSGSWGIHLMASDGVTMRRVKCFNHFNRCNDGIDIESRNVLIEDCDVDSMDDALCFKSESEPSFVIENVTVRRCRLATTCNFIKFGTGSYGHWKNIVIEQCYLHPAAKATRHRWNKVGLCGVTREICGLAGIALEVVDGGTMENVTVRDITMDGGVGVPLFVRFARRHAPKAGAQTYFRNVVVENVKMLKPAESRIAASITGLPGQRLSGVTVRNCDFFLPGGGTSAEAHDLKVPENAAGYPECFMFGMRRALPAYGLYLRHLDGVKIENVNFRLARPDARPCDYQEDCVMDSMRVSSRIGPRLILSYAGSSRMTPPVKDLEPRTLYRLRWVNPRTGEGQKPEIVHAEDDGSFVPSARPDDKPWNLELEPAGPLTLKAGQPQIIDFGAAGAGGYPTLCVTARDVPAGARLRVSYATHPDGLRPTGDFCRQTAARYLGKEIDLPILPANIDRYEFFTLSSNGTYRAQLLQGLVRYARLVLEAPTGTVTLASFDLVNDRVHSAGERQGSFACSDTGLTDLWEASVRTCELASVPAYYSVWGKKKGLTVPYLADGAKRDRLIWSGDLWWAQRSYYCGFRPEAPYMRGSLDMLAANQTPEGYVQASPWPDQPAPKAREWGPFGSDEFACWFVPVLADHYLCTGDRDSVLRHYPTMVRLLAYLAKYQDPSTGIFQQRAETDKHAMGVDRGDTQHRSYMNILLWKTYVDAATLATAVGKQQDATAWQLAAARLFVSIRATFWDESKGYFWLSTEKKEMGFEANALALAIRFVSEAEAMRIAPQLKRSWHGKFQQLMARGKFEYGAADAAIQAIDAHRWRTFVSPDWKGVHMTSECLGLNRNVAGDEAHPDTTIAGILTNYILGIRPLEPGFARFTFAPPVSRRITWASGTVPTPKGAIVCSWSRTDTGWKVQVKVPDQTRCWLRLPGQDPFEVGPGDFAKEIE